LMSASYTTLLYYEQMNFAWWPLFGVLISLLLLPFWLMQVRETDQCYFVTNRRLLVMKRSKLLWVSELQTYQIELSALHDTKAIVTTRYHDGSGSLSAANGVVFHYTTNFDKLDKALRRAVNALDCQIDQQNPPVLVWFVRLIVGLSIAVLVCVMLPLLVVIGLLLAQEYEHRMYPDDPDNSRPWYVPHSYFYITVSIVFCVSVLSTLLMIIRATWYVCETNRFCHTTFGGAASC
jgi:hypothetical protein